MHKDKIITVLRAGNDAAAEMRWGHSLRYVNCEMGKRSYGVSFDKVTLLSVMLFCIHANNVILLSRRLTQTLKQRQN